MRMMSTTEIKHPRDVEAEVRKLIRKIELFILSAWKSTSADALEKLVIVDSRPIYLRLSFHIEPRLNTVLLDTVFLDNIRYFIINIIR